MSEKRDLWVPAVLVLAGVGILAWHVMGVRAGPASPVAGGSSILIGIAALLVGLVGGVACLPLRLRAGQTRVVAFGIGVALVLLALLPIQSRTVLATLPWIVAALAFLAPIRAAPVQTRAVMLGGAGLLALLSVLAVFRVVPPSLIWLFVAAAFFLAAQVWSSRLRPEKPPPPGQLVCIFGGTFDPFHRGHRALAEAALRVNDRLLVVVAGSAPHKFMGEEGAVPDRTPFHHRVAMTRLGVERLPRTEVLELEGRRSGPSYTVDTLETLVRSYPPGTRFRILIGADMYLDFPNWHEWERILEQATLLVARRPGHELKQPPELEGRDASAVGLEAPLLEISSSAIRAAMSAREDPGNVLTPSVRAYLADHRLYGAVREDEAL